MPLFAIEMNTVLLTTLAQQTYLHVYHDALMLAGIMENVWRAIAVNNVNNTMFT